MKKILFIVAVAVLCIACNSRSGKRPIVKHPVDKEHNVVLRFNGWDRDLPKDGELLIIKCSLEDTVIVEPANLDDCRRILEENGKG